MRPSVVFSEASALPFGKVRTVARREAQPHRRIGMSRVLARSLIAQLVLSGDVVLATVERFADAVEGG